MPQRRPHLKPRLKPFCLDRNYLCNKAFLLPINEQIPEVARRQNGE